MAGQRVALFLACALAITGGAAPGGAVLVAAGAPSSPQVSRLGFPAELDLTSSMAL